MHDAPFATIEAARDEKQLVIHPLSDVHIGAHAHDAKRLKARLRFILEQGDHHRILLLGDLSDMQIPTSKHYEPGNTTAQTELEMLVEVFRPAAHRVDLIIPGNHEDRMARLGLDFSAQFAALIGRPEVYRNRPTVVRYSFARGPGGKRQEDRYRGRCEIFCHHGFGGGRGPKIGKVKALTGMKPDCHAYISGHVHGHESDMDEIPIGWPIKRRRRLYAVTGTYLDSELYALKQGYAQGAINSPELLIEFDHAREDAVVSITVGRHR